MTYRDDLTALAARYDALAGEVAQKSRELEDTRRMLDQAQARARQPVLDNIRIASPCSADWSQMTGDDRTRHCGECRKNVYNLSGMTREEAEALIVERNGDLCVRYYQRHDGTILLADCTVGADRTRRRRRVIGAAALFAGGLASALALAPRMFMMGKMKEPKAMMGAVGVPVELATPRAPSEPTQIADGDGSTEPPAPPSMRLPPEPPHGPHRLQSPQDEPAPKLLMGKMIAPRDAR